MRNFIFLAILLLGIGCSSKGIRKPDSASCKVEDANSCNDGLVCMNQTKDLASCVSVPEIAPVDNLILPFDSHTEVICTHSSGIGSHSWPNAFYALDLANRYTEKAATVLAAQDGKAFVLLGEDGKPCPVPEGTPQSSKPDSCGDGWGNRIKILHKDGYYSFYVHLEKTLIKNGQDVKQGQAIGIAGTTGLAGHRHLHWSVQKLYGHSQTEWEKNILTQDGQSVPFIFKAQTSNGVQSFNSSEVHCPHANIGGVPESEQPHYRGVFN